MRYLVYLYMINSICTYTGNVIFSSEMVETIPGVKKAIQGDDGVIHRGKIIMFRLAIWGISIFLSCFSENILGVLNLAGSFFTPIVSYFGPVVSI